MRFIKLISRFMIVLGLVLPMFAATTGSEAMAAGRKSIVVSLAKQRVYAYVGNTLVWSTPANIRGAKRGSFRIQNKIPRARSSHLGWTLPYWMGIYYVGRVQNGFHGTSIRDSGGYASNSLGCIVMPTAAAATLYSWAPVGTLVTIK